MIFLTVGSQTSFDRLVHAADECCARHGCEMLAQIGAGTYLPQHMRWFRMCSPAEFRRHCREADLIVAHAGMGSVLTALEFAKPMLLLPRRADLGETRNDHQLATANWLRRLSGISVVGDECQLSQALAVWRPPEGTAWRDRIAPTAQPRLVAALRHFIDGVDEV